MTPTGSSFGSLEPARLSRLDSNGNLISGDKPTKEMFFHRSLYEARSSARAIVHLHSTYCVALSCLPCERPDDE
jgi:ribulose-5-phosphate 4-epimerase/fuculose-1-phosphate aldolase